MEISGLTDVGRRRETNQDNFSIKKLDDHVCYAIVCDGMGGQNGGQLASKIACDTIETHLKDIGDELKIQNENPDESVEDIKSIMIRGMSKANMAVHEVASCDENLKGMGTTTILVVVIDDLAYITHIGDSRVYILNDKKLSQVTKDHSVVQELVDQGELTIQEALNHPNKNMITRAVGVNLLVDIDYLKIPFEEGNKLLICTDGLTNMVQDFVIENILLNHSVEESCSQLIELANKAGGYDNSTVVVISANKDDFAF